MNAVDTNVLLYACDKSDVRRLGAPPLAVGDQPYSNGSRPSQSIAMIDLSPSS